VPLTTGNSFVIPHIQWVFSGQPASTQGPPTTRRGSLY